MNYDAFIQKYLGKSIDFDGVYGPQCVDEVAQYCVDNNKPVAYANAKDWANHPALRGAFDWTDNNPNDLNQVPHRGDIIVWSGALPGSGGCGHIAIWDMVVRPGVFQSLDQNWGGQTVHFVANHTWDYVLGWWTPKAAPQPVPAPESHPDPAPANPPAPAPAEPTPVENPPTPEDPPADPVVVNDPVVIPPTITPEPSNSNVPESAQPKPLSLAEKIIWAVLAAIFGLLAWFVK